MVSLRCRGNFASRLEPPMALARVEPAVASHPVDDGDYETILSAIMATARGRRFLTEYARRSRQSDIQMILTEIDKLRCSHSDELFDFKSLALEKYGRD